MRDASRRIVPALLAGWAAALLMLGPVGEPVARAQDDSRESLRLGVWDLPPGRGNPFTGRSVPSTFVWDAIFDPLVRIGEDGAPEPRLATAWELVDETRWRFTLRDGVVFSNGAPFDADTVVAVFDYLTSEDGRASSVGGELANVVGAEKVDDRTVDIVTDGPDPVLPNKLALVFIPEPGAWAELGPEGFAEAPAGTGAFEVVEWGPGDVTLAAVEESWRDPALDGLTIVELPERPARLQALLSGQIDVAFGLSPDNLPQLEAEGYAVASTPAPQVMSLAFATEGRPDNPFGDLRVRQAVNYAVNRKAIAEVLLAGLGEAASHGATAAAFGWHPDLEPYPYDPERARALLEEAGFADGFEATAHVVVGSFPADSEIYQQTAIDLAEVGIDLTLEQIRFPEWLQFFLANTWPGEAFGVSWNSSPYMDSIRPYTYMSCMKTTPHYCDEEVMPLIEATFQEFDSEARKELLWDLHEASHENPPALYLVTQVDITGLSPEVGTFVYRNRTVDYDALSVAE